MATLTDPVNNTTSWTYDHRGRAVQETNALSANRTFTYDVSGNLVSKTDRNGRVTEYAYDYLNRGTNEYWKNGSTTARTFAFTYNRLGELLTAVDSAASYTYSYDGVGRATLIAAGITGLTPTVTLAQSYNMLSRRSQLAATIGATADFVNSYSYDGLGRMSSIAQSGVTGGNAVAEKRVDFTYDNGNQFASITRYNNTAGTQAVAGSTYAFDQAGRLTALSHAKGGSTLAGYTWTFDAGNRMTGQVSALDGTAAYTNDAASQLTGAAYTYQPSLDPETYAYDTNGNRTNNNYTVGTNNRLTSDGIYTYTYDAEGNRTSRINNSTGATTRYTWDYRNRIVLVAEYADANLSTLANKTTEFIYDYLNRWVTRTTDPDGDIGTTTKQQTAFLYDGNQIVGQLEATNDTPSLAHRYVWGPTVDQILADETATSFNTAGSVLWPLTDHLQTVRDIASYNSGTDTTAISNHRVYNAFGKVTSETNSVITCIFGFTGRAFDVSTSLQNNLHRWHDSMVGRWISEDPMGFGADDPNLTRYVGNNPVNTIDPNGLSDLFWSFSNEQVDPYLAQSQDPTAPNFVMPNYEYAARTALRSTEDVVIEAGITVATEGLGGVAGKLWTAKAARAAKAAKAVESLNSNVPKVKASCVQQGYSRVYRAVSEAEYQDILKTGQFRSGLNSLEGKWFADSVEGAQAHGKALFSKGKFRLIEADVPDNAPSLFRQPNLDGRGPARYIHCDDLNGVTPRPQ